MFWGLTPALDLLKYYKNNLNEINENELNILIIGGADCRHIIKTLAQRYRHNNVENIKINFHIIESTLETIGRQLLLLNIALQNDENFGLDQKTKTFMEIYGNTLVRPRVAKYLNATSMEFIKMITNYEYLEDIMPNIKLHLKYKERDYLENLFKFWCSNDNFNICHYWDKRLRKTLGLRYDSKLGAFDWDLHMRYHPMGGEHVCSQEYRTFRDSGIAFTWLESEVSKPNRSMVCAVMENGENYVHYGYLGDMETGPYIPYGLYCEDERYLNKLNGQNSYRSTDITERNLNQLFWEISNQQEYNQYNLPVHLSGQIVVQSPDKRVVDVGNFMGKIPIGKCIKLNNITITFSTTKLLDLMKIRNNYKNFYHLIYFGSTYLKYLQVDLIKNISNNNCLVVIENQRFVLNFRDKDLVEHQNKIKETLKDLEGSDKDFDVLKDDYYNFIVKK